MGGNGQYKAHKPMYFAGPGRPPLVIPAEKGGGCVTEGPFGKYVQF